MEITLCSNGETKNFCVDSLEGKRIDAALAEVCGGVTRSALQRLISQGSVLVNGKTVPKSFVLKTGDSISASLADTREGGALPENIPLAIVYEDDDIIVVDKPRGMVVHPAPGHKAGTLANALMHHCGGSLSGINGQIRPGIVHRIDKDTSGLIVAAKNDRAHRRLAALLAERKIKREYLAVALGDIKTDEFEIDKPIGRNPSDRKKMAVISAHSNAKSRNALTFVKVLERSGKHTFLSARLETGRTHQIRVHMASIGHPLLGDRVYGPQKQPLGFEGQVLHAQRLALTHPATGESMVFETELPEYFAKALKKTMPIRFYFQNQ